LGQGVGKLATSPPPLSRAKTESDFDCVGSAYVHVNIESSREKKRVCGDVRDIASCRSNDDDAQAPSHIARSLCLKNHTIYGKSGESLPGWLVNGIRTIFKISSKLLVF
jgi:hypothetical protein